jgi:hypothetical protein
MGIFNEEDSVMSKCTFFILMATGLAWMILTSIVSSMYCLGFFLILGNLFMVQGLCSAVFDQQEMQLYQNQGIMTRGTILQQLIHQGDNTSDTLHAMWIGKFLPTTTSSFDSNRQMFFQQLLPWWE